MGTAAPPHARETQIFPRLDAATIARLVPYGTLEAPPAGTVVFARGDHAADFFVVLEGAIALYDPSAPLNAEAFRFYDAGQFTGELHLFNDRALLVTGIATADTRLLRISRAEFRRMVSTEADIGETIMRAFILRRVELIAQGQGGVTVVGSAHSPDTNRIRAFLTRNAHPFRFLDPEADADVQAGRPLPLAILPGGETLENPDTAQLAAALGLAEAGEPGRIYDVAVVGAGPAGLAASVYAASEGLATIVIEGEAPGGQAGTSSRIENYLGFPTGISGLALAGRAQVQAQKFGARLSVSQRVEALDCSDRPFRLSLEGGAMIQARSVVIATGARYRRLSVPGYDRLEGRGIYYAATPMEAQLCAGQEVVVVGGGNSAGQAAVFLARGCRHVHVLVRSEGLAATMSDYLVRRITDSTDITLHPHTEIVAVDGKDSLETVRWTNRLTGASEDVAVGGLFVMIGADPNTAWVRGCIPTDAAGFVLTGTGEDGTPLGSPYATSVPGVFAVGDVRAGSVKRVASGVGEGSVVISAVHRFLAEGDATPG